jgi:hypothetical protein
MAIRVLKSALNAADDGHAGLQVKPAIMLTLPLEVGTAAGELLSACCITDGASALGAWRECHANILRHGGGKGREERVHGETTPRFLQVPTQTLSFSSLLNWPIILLIFPNLDHYAYSTLRRRTIIIFTPISFHIYTKNVFCMKIQINEK